MTEGVRDPRRVTAIGHDQRRGGFDPCDQARADAFAEQHGAVLDVYMLAQGQIRFAWRDRRGQTIAVEGPSAAECVALMQQAIAADVLDISGGSNRGNV